MSSSLFWVILWCLGAAGTVSTSKENCECPCPEPPARSLTKPPDAENCCSTGSMFRYACLDGYVRKAGTSNLTKCKKTANGLKWSTSNLVCIPDPKLKSTKQPINTTTDHLHSTSTSSASPKSFISDGVTTFPSTTEPPTPSSLPTELDRANTPSPLSSFQAQTEAPSTTPSSLPTELDRSNTPSPLTRSQAQTEAAHTAKTATSPTSPTISTQSEPQATAHTDHQTFAHSLAPSTTEPPTPSSLPTELDRSNTPSPLSSSQAQTEAPSTTEPPTPSSLPTELDRSNTPSPLSSSQAQTEVTLGPQTETKGTTRVFETSTSTSAFLPTETESSNRNVSSRQGHMDTLGTGLGAVGVILLVAMTLLAISYWWCKRNRSQSPVPQSTAEERTAMNLSQL